MSNNDIKTNDQKFYENMVEKLKNKESLIKKAIITCLAFTYCAFILSSFPISLNIKHSGAWTLEHVAKYNSPLRIEHTGKYDHPLKIEHGGIHNSSLKLEIDNAGVYSLPFKIEVKK
jgi:hypothetical protein